MADEVTSNDTRVELDAQGKPLPVSHQTKARMTSGVAGWFRIGGQGAAVVGSSGQNTGEHEKPKVGQVLLPLSTRVTIRSGEPWFLVDGKPIATTESKAQVPDVKQPLKSGVIQTDNDFLFVEGSPPLRGS
jgi:uncharacterized Zn-binding protein involved in type VI secretion